jgi:hypothetical protein
MAEPEESLADRAVALLRSRLPPTWTVELGTSEPQGLTLTLGVPSYQTAALVDVRPFFRPGDVEALLGGLARRLRNVGKMPIIVVSEALSPRAREVLTDEDFGYIDIAGNARISFDYPPVFIELTADKTKTSVPQDRTLRGAKAARLIRFLCDVQEPYGVLDIERATNLSRGYVSRLLDRLTDEALIERAPRGPVIRVDWARLLRRRAQDVDLLRTNNASTYIARSGADALLESLGRSQMASELVITGSFAAYRLAPAARPTLLALYSTRQQSGGIAQEFGLLPASEGGDVVILRPPDDIALQPTTVVDGVRYAAPSQVVIDCLSGPGRMPAEGDAVLDWMATNVDEWRSTSIDNYLKRVEAKA